MRLETRLALLMTGGLLLGLAGCDGRQGVATDTAADARQDRAVADEQFTPVPDESTYTTGTTGRTENPGTATTMSPGVGGETDMRGRQDGQPGAAEARQFIMAVAQTNMLELQAGKLAQERAGSEEIRSFANTMVRTHSRVQESLGQLARNMGVQMPTDLDPQRQAVLKKLRGLKGEAFDRTFSEEMVRSHQMTVQLFEDVAKTAQDPQLQSFAQGRLPALREHLKLARSLPGAPRG